VLCDKEGYNDAKRTYADYCCPCGEWVAWEDTHQCSPDVYDILDCTPDSRNHQRWVMVYRDGTINRSQSRFDLIRNEATTLLTLRAAKAW